MLKRIVISSVACGLAACSFDAAGPGSPAELEQRFVKGDALPAGNSSPPTGSRASAAVAITVIGTDPTQPGKLFQKPSSGVLVDSNVVVTAAHLFEPDPDFKPIHAQTTVAHATARRITRVTPDGSCARWRRLRDLLCCNQRASPA